MRLKLNTGSRLPTPNHHYARATCRNWDQDQPDCQDFQNHYGRTLLRSNGSPSDQPTSLTWSPSLPGHDYSVRLRQDHHYDIEPRRSYDSEDWDSRDHDEHHYRRQMDFERRR